MSFCKVKLAGDPEGPVLIKNVRYRVSLFTLWDLSSLTLPQNFNHWRTFRNRERDSSTKPMISGSNALKYTGDDSIDYNGPVVQSMSRDSGRGWDRTLFFFFEYWLQRKPRSEINDGSPCTRMSSLWGKINENLGPTHNKNHHRYLWIACCSQAKLHMTKPLRKKLVKFGVLWYHFMWVYHSKRYIKVVAI